MKGRTRTAKAYADKIARFLASLTQKNGIECVPSAFHDNTYIYIDWREPLHISYTDIGDDGSVDVVNYFGPGTQGESHVILDRRQNYRWTIYPDDNLHFRGVGRAVEFQESYDKAREVYAEQTKDAAEAR